MVDFFSAGRYDSRASSRYLTKVDENYYGDTLAPQLPRTPAPRTPKMRPQRLKPSVKSVPRKQKLNISAPPNNSLLINFPLGCNADEDVVRKELSRFGKVKSVSSCFIDGCQSFVIMDDDIRRVGGEYAVTSGDSAVERIINDNRGLLSVHGFIWTVTRPSDQTSCHQSRMGGNDLIDGPSPLRRGRLNKLAGATTLMNVYQNYRYHHMQASSVTSKTSTAASTSSINPISEKSSFFSSTPSTSISCSSAGPSTLLQVSSFESVASNATSFLLQNYPIAPVNFAKGYLPLAPPYHILPDTPFFRNTNIIPPPRRPNEGVGTLQRILNRYLESMEQNDEQQIAELEELEDSHSTRFRRCHSTRRGFLGGTASIENLIFRLNLSPVQSHPRRKRMQLMKISFFIVISRFNRFPFLIVPFPLLFSFQFFVD
ncbi:unnamed protein product [Caenorhabditis auriculariae]|uniref:Uncharacterized protein n=1 Tax=Caenorhabditis auriculariae TaxID=2777116 RepID=A0A8S1HFN9_9PELO|nr:unnamed protein product [Caenorhabditis auriculariae]